MAKLSRRHHTVQKFLLKWFSTAPAEDNPLIWRLDKATGRQWKNSVDNETVIGHFNRLENAPPGIPADAAEQDLARIDSDCSPSLAKAIRREALTEDDLQQILIFSVFQQRRTPRGRQWQTEVMEHGERLAAEVDFSTTEFIEHLKKERGISDEDARTLRDEVLADLKEGRLGPQSTRDEEVLGMFRATYQIVAYTAPRARVIVLHAVGAEFVMADHPVCMFDPMAPLDRGIGWAAPTSEVTFPISPTTCLLFQRGPWGYAHVEANVGIISDINLRTYAGAGGRFMARRNDGCKKRARRLDGNGQRSCYTHPESHAWFSSRRMRETLDLILLRFMSQKRRWYEALGRRTARFTLLSASKQ